MYKIVFKTNVYFIIHSNQTPYLFADEAGGGVAPAGEFILCYYADNHNWWRITSSPRYELDSVFSSKNYKENKRLIKAGRKLYYKL